MTRAAARRTPDGLLRRCARAVTLLTLATLACAPVRSAGGLHDLVPGLRAVFTRGVDAWNAGDLEGYLECYAKHDFVSYVSSSGVTRGGAAVRALYRERFPDPAAMGALELSDLELTPLETGVGLAIGRFEHTAHGKTTRGVFTVLLRSIDGEWKIVHDHSSALE